ncbi:hypothetical protein EZS27_028376 [termite gut metagenome]|uniref:Uncharacterized protein n=1 Tax=termite gut metagenome TaxID=433724 RepID=A0A5J4QN49_9ZZZZ
MNELTALNIPYRELAVDPQAAAPMLGYADKMPEDIVEIVREVMDETTDCYDIRGGYRIFDRLMFNKDDYSVCVEDMTFHVGKIIYHQLKHSSRIALFVCTADGAIHGCQTNDCHARLSAIGFRRLPCFRLHVPNYRVSNPKLPT